MKHKGANMCTTDRDPRHPASIMRVNTPTGTWRLDATTSRVGIMAKTLIPAHGALPDRWLDGLMRRALRLRRGA